MIKLVLQTYQSWYQSKVFKGTKHCYSKIPNIGIPRYQSLSYLITVPVGKERIQENEVLLLTK